VADRGVQSLCDLFEASVRAHADLPAVVAPDGTTLTYAELNDRADRIAGFLRARGVVPGDRVGFCLPKGTASLAVMMGAMKARAAYVPIDWQGPAARNRTILSDCAVAALFLGEERADVLREWTGGLPKTLVRVPRNATGSSVGGSAVDPGVWWRSGAVPITDVLAHAPLKADPRTRRRTDVAYILYTSGSTGVPKGVTLTQENAVSFVHWCSSVLDPLPTDRLSSHAPFHFDLSVLDVHVAFKHGATLVLVSEELGKDPKSLARFIAQQRITMWYSTPSVLAMLVDFGALEMHDLGALRTVCFAGEVFPVPALRRLTRQIPGAAYFNLYGPTETNVCTFFPVPLPIPDERTQPFPIGQPCQHCEGIVLDEKRADVPRGADGILWVAGPSVFRGYWNQPDLDKQVFLQRDGKRWYCTGDVVREDPRDGFVFVGRKDRMVKRRGLRIELGEIEVALQRNPELREAAVIVLGDPQTGVKIRAHVSGRKGIELSLVALKRFCSAALPTAMSPDLFVIHDALPRTSTDKIDYQALQKHGAAT